MHLLDLSGHGALVVGAGKGIGRATARMLAAAGAHTIVLDRHADRAAEVVREIAAAGGRAAAVVADVQGGQARDRALDEAFARVPDLDVLVDITGSATWRPLLEQDDASWDRDHGVDLRQPFGTCRAVVRRWRAQTPVRSGVICVVGSISGVFASPGHAAYGAAKAGLLAFVRSAAEEWGALGVRVNAVVPGSVRTPRIEETLMQASGPLPEAMLARMASPEDVAGSIAYLVSGLARRVTGQTIVVDGGTSSRFPYALE